MPYTRVRLPLRLLLTLLVAVFPLLGSSAQDGARSRAGTPAGTARDTAAVSMTERSVPRIPNVRTAAVDGRVSAEAPVLAGPAALASTIMTEASGWLGTRYRFGGSTRRGIDCSAFVQRIMRDALEMELPRTTATQVHEGQEVSRDELLPGDLVFFRRRGVRHVGIYLGAGEFVHASSSRGVVVDNLTEGYYQRHFWTARRVVEDPMRFVAGEVLNPVEGVDAMVRPGRSRR